MPTYPNRVEMVKRLIKPGCDINYRHPRFEINTTDISDGDFVSCRWISLLQDLVESIPLRIPPTSNRTEFAESVPSSKEYQMIIKLLLQAGARVEPELIEFLEKQRGPNLVHIIEVLEDCGLWE